MKNKYRVTLWKGSTGSLCYIPQIKRWWFPVWMGLNAGSLYSDKEQALEAIRLDVTEVDITERIKE